MAVSVINQSDTANFYTPSAVTAGIGSVESAFSLGAKHFNINKGIIIDINAAASRDNKIFFITASHHFPKSKYPI